MGGVRFKDIADPTVGLSSKQLEAVSSLDPELVRIGHEVIMKQKKETFREAWKNHWRAALWSMFLTSALFMEGFDTAVINSFFGLPAFLHTFGKKEHGKLLIPANYQSGLTNIAYIGQMIGLLINGWCQERFGARRAFIWGMIVMTLTIFLAVFAVSLDMLLVAELAMGIPWGAFQTLSTAYAAEICPIQLRGYLNAFASVGYGGGAFLSAGVLKACDGITGNMGWKIPYILQWIWPVPLATGAFFAPESAWWLARKGRFAEAEQTVVRCARPGFYADGEAAGYVTLMQYADLLEKVDAAEGSWKEMFQGTNLRRTEIMLGVWGTQLWNGNIITGLTVLMLENAGMSVAGAFNMNLVLSAMSIVGVMISWVALSHLGRRTIYLTGIMSIGACLLPIGILGFIKQTPTTARAMGSLMICINLFFHFSLGPVCYSIVGELPASRLRSRSIVLGRFFYLVSAIVGTQLRTRMTAKDAWNWGAKSALFWLGCNLICLTWTFFRLPETGGFSFEELDILFSNRVPTRRFKQFKIKSGSQQMEETAEKDVEEKQELEHVEQAAVLQDVVPHQLATVEPNGGHMIVKV